jgi:hypothetical protein
MGDAASDHRQITHLFLLVVGYTAFSALIFVYFNRNCRDAYMVGLSTLLRLVAAM